MALEGDREPWTVPGAGEGPPSAWTILHLLGAATASGQECEDFFRVTIKKKTANKNLLLLLLKKRVAWGHHLSHTQRKRWLCPLLLHCVPIDPTQVFIFDYFFLKNITL